MIKEDKLSKQTEIVITFLIGLLAITIAIMMVLLQEFYKLFPPSPTSVIFQLIVCFVAYIFIIFIILEVMQKSFVKKKSEKKEKKEEKIYEALSRNEVFRIFIVVFIIQIALDLFSLPIDYDLMDFLIRYARAFLFSLLASTICWVVFLKFSHTELWERIFHHGHKDPKFILFLLLLLFLLIILIYLF